MAQQIIVLDKPSKKGKGKGAAAPVARGASGKATGKGKGNGSNVMRADDGPRRGSDLCLSVVPAPNMYKLKNLVGYQDHDISKWREPAYSMRTRHESKKGESVPGPKYDIGDVTRFGTKNPLMFSLGRRNSLPEKKEIPGPSAYSPEKFEDPRYRKPPSASLKGRVRDTKGIDMPSPAEYESPGGIGQGNPTMHSAPNAVLTSRRDSKPKFNAPAPNTYGSPNVEVTKKSAPMSSIAGRQQDKKGEKVPGPGSYNPIMTNVRSPPAYSFGTKHSKCIQNFQEPESEAEVC